MNLRVLFEVYYYYEEGNRYIDGRIIVDRWDIGVETGKASQARQAGVDIVVAFVI